MPADGQPERITPQQLAKASEMVQTPIAWDNCPSFRSEKLFPVTITQYRNMHDVDPAANIDYLANWGDRPKFFDEGPRTFEDGLAGRGFRPKMNREEITGVVFPRSKIPMKDIPGGTSKTYLVGESAQQQHDGLGQDVDLLGGGDADGRRLAHRGGRH